MEQDGTRWRRKQILCPQGRFMQQPMIIGKLFKCCLRACGKSFCYCVLGSDLGNWNKQRNKRRRGCKQEFLVIRRAALRTSIIYSLDRNFCFPRNGGFHGIRRNWISMSLNQTLPCFFHGRIASLEGAIEWFISGLENFKFHSLEGLRVGGDFDW